MSREEQTQGREGAGNIDSGLSRPIRTLVSGVAFGESARWHEGRVWFCDWVSREVISVAPDGSDHRVHAQPDGAPVCIDWGLDGKLLVVDGSNHLLLERDNGEGLEVVADLSDISDRPWNEVAAHPSGRTYVNGIGFDMMTGEPPATGQIAVIEPDGSVRGVADGLEFPNGMVITPDGTTLVVAESYAGRLSAFSISDNGDLEDRWTFAEVKGSAPDGICLAPDGSVWYADVPNQHCQRVAEGGAILDTVDVGRGCFSCALSPDGTLYVTAAVFDDDTFTTSDGVVIAVEVDVTPDVG